MYAVYQAVGAQCVCLGFTALWQQIMLWTVSELLTLMMEFVNVTGFENNGFKECV